MKSRLRILGIAAAAVAIGMGSTSAKGPDLDTDRFNISFGTYLISFDTSAQLSPVSGAGTIVNMEEILGLDDRRTDVRIDGYWRFAHRHRLDWGVFFDSRKGTRDLSEQIIWDDTTYDIGATIDSKFTTEYFKLAYRFAFVRDDRAEAGLSAGLATMRLGIQLEGQGTIDQNGTPSSLQFVRESKDVLAPVPVIGLYGAFKITDGWYFRPSVEFLSYSGGDLEASIVDTRATVDWYFTERWGLGLGFSRVRLHYADEGGDPQVQADSKFGGGVFYLNYGF